MKRGRLRKWRRRRREDVRRAVKAVQAGKAWLQQRLCKHEFPYRDINRKSLTPGIARRVKRRCRKCGKVVVQISAVKVVKGGE